MLHNCPHALGDKSNPIDGIEWSLSTGRSYPGYVFNKLFIYFQLVVEVLRKQFLKAASGFRVQLEHLPQFH